jgi:hypothetical protein
MAKKKKDVVTEEQAPVTNVLPPDVITPLQAFAFEAHELYGAFKEAGFNEDESWDLLTRLIPAWSFPGFEDAEDDYDEEDD